MFEILTYALAESQIKQLIKMDMDRYLKWNPSKNVSDLVKLKKCLKYKEFKSIFRYRMSGASKIFRLISKIDNKISSAYKNIEIGGEIDGGLMISHSYCVVFPKKAGKNLRIGPGVVIGRNGKGFPIIGNNVYICANATVIGNITIGNNKIIGAGSVVTKDIPDNSVVVGNPSRIIRKINESDFNEIM